MPEKSAKHYQVQASEKLRTLFKDIKEYDPLFKNLAIQDFFMLAVQFGYAQGTRLPLRGNDIEGWTRPGYFGEQDLAALRAIAYEATGDLGMLTDIVAVFNVAEEYANGGAAPLKDFFFEDPGDFTKKFSRMIREHKPAK